MIEYFYPLYKNGKRIGHFEVSRMFFMIVSRFRQWQKTTTKNKKKTDKLLRNLRHVAI